MTDFEKFIKCAKGKKILFASVDRDDLSQPIFDFCEVVVSRSGEGLYRLKDKDGGCLTLNPIDPKFFQCNPLTGGRAGMKGICWDDTEYSCSSGEMRFINYLFVI